LATPTPWHARKHQPADAENGVWYYDNLVVLHKSTFPAVLLSTMVILIINQGIPFARATGKILILSSSNIIVYGIVVYFTFPALGIALGTAVSFAASLIWVLALRPVSDLLSKK